MAMTNKTRFRYEVYVDTKGTGSFHAGDMELILSTNDYDRAKSTANFWDERVNVILSDTRITDEHLTFEERQERTADRLTKFAFSRMHHDVSVLPLPNIYLALNRINEARYELYLLKTGPKHYHAWNLTDLDKALEEG
jgi:hypothetical protein